MKKSLALLNLISIILVIGINYIAQVLRLNDTTIGEVSGQYNSLFTPAGYAFSIWGLIYLGLLCYAIFQIRRAFFSAKSSDFIAKTGYWFLLANVLNASWVVAFSYNYIGLSVLLMLGILFALIKIILNTNMERWDAPIAIIAFVWWPICIYSGWIAVATIANVAIYLTKIGWNGSFLTPETGTIIMLITATILNLLMIWKRNMREFALVGIWALIAIYFKQKPAYATIANTAMIGSIILIINVCIHAFKNRKTNPLQKLLERSSES
ncbi:tryptophan-rich sensory protein [Croceitalea vernalis]|uniref:Tryptophan-rich sensory protein n=1 Tax=Croceitalea vernalis TaxID=3075599 RepID=A0ABU3BF97_9FLAO|nr:tryptophan-rich sensory protein [Croceitalea sp. P007]MDT0620821.1 tryptophan-rich sensory protein [Croceitalea sp. P007]